MFFAAAATVMSWTRSVTRSIEFCAGQGGQEAGKAEQLPHIAGSSMHCCKTGHRGSRAKQQQAASGREASGHVCHHSSCHACITLLLVGAHTGCVDVFCCCPVCHRTTWPASSLRMASLMSSTWQHCCQVGVHCMQQSVPAELAPGCSSRAAASGSAATIYCSVHSEGVSVCTRLLHFHAAGSWLSST